MGRPELIPMFANVNVPIDEAGNTDSSSLTFNQAIVALASLCGKSFGAINTNTDKGIFDVVDVLKMKLTSFGIQVKNAAQLHHSKCFVGNGQLVTNHLLLEIIEWKLLEQAINPSSRSATCVHAIYEHMQEISVLRTQSIIISEESEQNAAKSLDCKIMPMLIGKLQMADSGDESLAELKVGVAQGLSHFEP
eukprot:1044028-Rhodomonas_salina.1